MLTTVYKTSHDPAANRKVITRTVQHWITKLSHCKTI
jgi:hypothetical protein